MSLPIARSPIPTHNHEDIGLYRNVSNHITLSDGVPSEVAFEFELPRDEMNINFNVNPSVKKLTATCYHNGSRTVLAGKCIRSRKTNIQPVVYQCPSREFSQHASVSSGARNETSDANSVSVHSSCQPVLSGSLQNAMHSSQSRSKHSSSASISLEEPQKQVATALSFDQAMTSQVLPETSAELTQKLRYESSADSVLNAIHLKNYPRGLLERSIATALWVEDSPEVTDTLLSQIPSSVHSSLIEKTSECTNERTPSRYLENDSRRELEDTDYGANFKSTDKTSELVPNLVGLSSVDVKQPCSALLGSSILLNDEDLKEEPEALHLNTVRSINENTSSRQAKLLLEVSSDQSRGNMLSHIEKTPSEEMACMELCSASEHGHERARSGSRKTRSAKSGGVERNRFKHTDAEDEARDLEESESSVASEREREAVAKIIMSRRLLQTETRQILAVLQAKSGSFATFSVGNEEMKVPKQPEQSKSWDKNHDSHELKSSEVQDEDAAFSSSSSSQLSIPATYRIGSNTSLRGADLPEHSEAADDDGSANESDTRHRVNNYNRKKKSSLYSETQSTTIPPEARTNTTGASARTSLNSTDGDGTTTRRGTVDTGVRIGHTSINYFLSWDTDGLVQQEHMYNSTGIGVQERGQERTSSTRIIRQQKKYQTNQNESDVVEDNNIGIESRSNANNIENCGKFVHEKYSVTPEGFIDHNMSQINERVSNEFSDSFDFLSQSQSSFEYNSPSSSRVSRATISKSSTTLFTLFSKNQTPKSISQSNIERNGDISQHQNVTVLFENSLQTPQDDSSTGLISNLKLDAPASVVSDKVRPRTELCASDETHVIRRKRHRLTMQAREYLKKYDAASTTGSEECVSVDQLDVSNSSIVLRRKRNKSVAGLTFLQIRRTHPCRNLPRLMLKQEHAQLFCGGSDSSHSQIIKEVSVEDVKDYSQTCCNETTGSKKPKWVQSLDNLIDFQYIVPKITRLGNDERIFFKKGVTLAKKQSKSATELQVRDVGNRADTVTTLQTVGQDVRRRSKTRSITKSEAFRANRKRRYTIVKVDTSVDKESPQLNGPEQAETIRNTISTGRESSQLSKETGVSLKIPAGVTRNGKSKEGKGDKESSKERKSTMSRKGRLSAFLGCVTAATSGSEQASNTNRRKTSRRCSKDVDKPPFSGRTENVDGTSDNVAQENDERVGTRKRTKEVVDCTNTKAHTDKNITKKVLGIVAEKGQPECTSSQYATTSKERELMNKTESVAGKKGVDIKKRIKSVLIGGGNTNEAIDGRIKTDKDTKKNARVIETDNSALSDCVQKVSFVDACSSIRAKKGANIDLSDEGWVTDETSSIVSEHAPIRSEQPVAVNSKQIESVIEKVNSEGIEQVNSIKSVRSPVASFFLSKKATKKAATVAASLAACEDATRPSSAATRGEDTVPIKMTARQRAAEYDRKNKLRLKIERECKMKIQN